MKDLIINFGREAGRNGFTTKEIVAKVGCSLEYARKTVMNAGAKKGRFRRNGQNILFLN